MLDVVGHIVTLGVMVDDGAARDDGWHAACMHIHDPGNRADMGGRTMRVVISNIAGGDVKECRTLASLARHATPAPYGGWAIVSCDGISKDDARATCAWSESMARDMSPRTAADWERVADAAIAFGA